MIEDLLPPVPCMVLLFTKVCRFFPRDRVWLDMSGWGGMGWDGAGLGSKNQSGQGKVLINSLPEHPGEEKFQITPRQGLSLPRTSPPHSIH